MNTVLQVALLALVAFICISSVSSQCSVPEIDGRIGQFTNDAASLNPRIAKNAQLGRQGRVVELQTQQNAINALIARLQNRRGRIAAGMPTASCPIPGQPGVPPTPIDGPPVPGPPVPVPGVPVYDWRNPYYRPGFVPHPGPGRFHREAQVDDALDSEDGEDAAEADAVINSDDDDHKELAFSRKGGVAEVDSALAADKSQSQGSQTTQSRRIRLPSRHHKRRHHAASAFENEHEEHHHEEGHEGHHKNCDHGHKSTKVQVNVNVHSPRHAFHHRKH